MRPEAVLNEVVGLTCQKIGNLPGQNDDAWGFNRAGEVVSVAVADGATESAFSGPWAREIVDSAVLWPDSLSIAEAQQKLRGLGATFQRRRLSKAAEMPWYMVEKATRGASATLLWIVVDLSRRWYQVRHIGDSCSVVIPSKADVIVLPKPLRFAENFGSDPYLVGSVARDGEIGGLKPWLRKSRKRKLEVGTTQFIAMTDALAAWFMAASERGDRPWEVLARLTSNADLREFVETQRKIGRLRNDDTTVVRWSISVSSRPCGIAWSRGSFRRYTASAHSLRQDCMLSWPSPRQN